MSPTQVKRYLYDTVIDDFKSEGLGSFRHLGSVLRKGNKARTDTLSTIKQHTAHTQHLIHFPVVNFCHEILN
jgi:hypothetical protein